MKKDLILITSYCDTKEKMDVLRNLVKQISEHRNTFDLMIISHTTIPEDISEKTTLSIYDSKNELLYDWNLRSTPWFDPNNERPIHSIFTGFFNTHLAIWRMIIIGNSIAKNLGYNKVHHLEYDSDIKDFSEFYDNSKLLNYKDAVVYNKIVSTVDPIIFGTFQSYNINKIHEELLNLNEEKIKKDIRDSVFKSPEKMLFDLLNHNGNVEVKNKNVLDTNGNSFGMSHNKVSNGNTAWCLPYYDMLTKKLGFVIWNVEEFSSDISVQLIYNDDRVIDLGITPHLHWRLLDIDDYSNTKKLVVILNNKIRNIFEFENYREEFKDASYRLNYKRP